MSLSLSSKAIGYRGSSVVACCRHEAQVFWLQRIWKSDTTYHNRICDLFSLVTALVSQLNEASDLITSQLLSNFGVDCPLNLDRSGSDSLWSIECSLLLEESLLPFSPGLGTGRGRTSLLSSNGVLRRMNPFISGTERTCNPIQLSLCSTVVVLNKQVARVNCREGMIRFKRIVVSQSCCVLIRLRFVGLSGL